jgi:hypothetical protein
MISTSDAYCACKPNGLWSSDNLKEVAVTGTWFDIHVTVTQNAVMNFILASYYAYFAIARWSSYAVKFFQPKAWPVQGMTSLKSETLFIFPKMSRPPLGQTKPPIHWIFRIHSLRVQAPSM